MTIRALRDLSRADLSVAGGKGANLGELCRLDLPVPPGFVVTTTAYAEHGRLWHLADRLSAHLASSNWDAVEAEAADLFMGGELSPAFEAALREAYRALGSPKVAVRSSATAEDLADASFAGQHETFLNVSGEDDFLRALRQCWASLFSARALRYRALRGIDHLGVDIAVVVQAMVPSEFAGVLFTVDPVLLRSDRMLLEVAPGLGEAVVSGQTTGDVYRMTRALSGSASWELVPPVLVDRDIRDPQGPVPSDSLLLELGRMGLRLEAHFGCPQDVEFAFAKGSVYLLQSRPITTLGNAEIEPIPPLPNLTFMQQRMLRLNDADRFPIAPLPIDRWGFRVSVPALCRTVRFVGFDIDREAERQAMDEVWREVLILPSPSPTFRLLGLPSRVSRSLSHDWMGWWEGEAFPKLMEVCGPIDLQALEDAALFAHGERIVQTSADVLGKRFEGIVGLMGTAPLMLMVRMAVGAKRVEVVAADLLSGLHTRTSDVNLALFQLSRRALSASAEVHAAIREGRPQDLQRSEAGRAFLAEAEAFLNEHGHRETIGLYLSAPTWQQDPTPMWGLLRGLLDAKEPPSEHLGHERYEAAFAEVSQKLRVVPGLSARFQRLLERLRKTVVYRERSHYDLTRAFSAVQAVVAELGRRLCARGHLSSERDIVYLTEVEARDWLLGKAPTPREAKEMIRRRRATYQVVNARWQERAFAVNAANDSGDVLSGIGASSGFVRAKARLIRDEHEFDRLRPGEILVCRYTNPAWTPLFAFAAGVVTDVGGAASHAAIVAREYGIPAVLGASGATSRIAEGQEILVDGTSGRVTLLQRRGEKEPRS